MAAFQAGNIVVYRVGDGSAALSSAATAVFLDEYTPTGMLVQSINVTGSNPLTASGTASSEGLVSDVGDGSGIIITGYDAPVGTTGIAATTAAADPRVVGIVSASGTVDTTTTLGGYDSGNNIRSAASADGTNIYVGAAAGGAAYTMKGSTATPTSLDAVNTRQVMVTNGQLYYSTGSGTPGIYSLGSGTPTSGTQTPTLIAGTGTGSSPYEFFFASIAAPNDTLYVADSAKGIDKFSLVNGTYTLTGSSALTNVTGVTGSVSNGVVTLFASSPTALSSIVDASGAGGTLTATPTTIATPGTNRAFRGDALTPQSVCYCDGTRIACVRDGETVEVAVETLRIGDVVVTASGAHRPIRWMGHRAYAPRFANANPEILPIRIAADALAEGVPTRDLWVSPLHALYLDGVLVPAKHLVNDVTVVKSTSVERDLRYYHVELDGHDILLAEGAPAESFVDDCGRVIFHNASSFHDLYPDAETVDAVYCAPRVEEGHVLAKIRRRLAERAGLAGAANPRFGALRGGIDLYAEGVLHGWAQDMLHPAAPVCLDIVVDGVVVDLVYAGDYRRDLADAGVGSHAFSVSLALSSSVDHRIEVRRSADQAAVAAPLHVTAATLAA